MPSGMSQSRMAFSWAGKPLVYVWANSTASASSAVVTMGISFGTVGEAFRGVACQLASNQSSWVPSGFSSEPLRSILVLWSLFIRDLAAQIADQRDPLV